MNVKDREHAKDVMVSLEIEDMVYKMLIMAKVRAKANEMQNKQRYRNIKHNNRIAQRDVLIVS